MFSPFSLNMNLQSISDLYTAVRAMRWSDSIRIFSSFSQGSHTREEEYQNRLRDELYSLHRACSHHAPIGIIRSIVKASNGAALRRDSDGNIPLYIALASSSDETIITLIEACPEAASIRDGEGYTLLKRALRLNKSMGVIRALVVADPSPVCSYFKKWNLKMREIVRQPNEAAPPPTILKLGIGGRRRVNRLYKRAIIFLKALTHEYCDKSFSTDSRFLAVHASLKVSFCPWSFYRLILIVNPIQALMKDDDGNYPLHVAAASRSSLDGNLYGCSKCGSSFGDKSWFQDKNGFDHLCQNCFQCSMGSDDDDYKMMHSVEKTTAAIEQLLEIDPKPARVLNCEGRLPFHLAIEEGKTLQQESILKLLRAAPEAIRTRDIKTRMFPFMLSAVQREPKAKNAYDVDKEGLDQLSSVFLLLKEDPSLISIGIPTKTRYKRKREDDYCQPVKKTCY